MTLPSARPVPRIGSANDRVRSTLAGRTDIVPPAAQQPVPESRLRVLQRFYAGLSSDKMSFSCQCRFRPFLPAGALRFSLGEWLLKSRHSGHLGQPIC